MRITRQWVVTIWYRTDGGIVDVVHDVEELCEVAELVERGPHWDTIDKIEITKLRDRNRELTVEASERLAARD